MPISVITVAFNAQVGLRTTIASLRPFAGIIDEYIVIDGGSVDGTAALLASDPLVTFWLSEPDTGIYDAMNKGWALAKPANSVLFLGAGDQLLSLPGRDEALGRSVIYGDVELEGRGRFVARCDVRLRLGNTLHHQALLVPKSFHPPPPFDTRYRVYADFDFNQRLLKQGCRFTKSASFLAFAAADGVSHRRNEEEMTNVVRKNFGAVTGLMSRAYLGFQNLRARQGAS